MIHSKADTSFLNYSDEEDLARDAGVYWKYFSRKHHSPTLENIVEWATVTEEVPKKQRKPAFSQLPELKAQMAAEKTAADIEIQQKFGPIYRDKREQRAAIASWREQRRQEIILKHDEAWAQRENRDSVIRHIKDGYYWAKTKMDKTECVNLSFEPQMTKTEQGKFVEVQRQRAKTEKEMFQDVLDACFAECGDENQARVEAEMYLTLELGLDPLKMDLTAQATARGALIDNFEQQAYSKYIVETLKVLDTQKSETELEAQWTEEIAAQFKEEKQTFLKKEWLENLKPARLDETVAKRRSESFNIFQIMDAWVRKHNHFISREQKEALEEVIEVGQGEFLSEKPVAVPDQDGMVAAKKNWDTDNLQKKIEQFHNTFKKLEEKYKIFYWLLSVPVIKDFILKCANSLLLQPNFDVQETVLQVEIITHVCMNRELDKRKVEEHADEFLNSWIRLQDGEGGKRDLQAYRQLLVQEFVQLANELIRGNYALVGSWTKVRRMMAEVARMAAMDPPNFNIQTKLSAYLQN